MQPNSSSINLQRLRLVPSEAKIFEQKPRPTNLSNPSAIAFTKLENHPPFPSNYEFAKPESVIGEFLQTSSTDPQPITEVEGNIILIVTPKDPPLPSSITKHLEPQQAVEGSVLRRSTYSSRGN